jgi:hypothetical protein
MLRRTNSILLLLLLLALLFTVGAIPAHADGVPVYLVAGSITLVGNPGCASPCTETIGFSFDVSFQPNPNEANNVMPFVSNLTQIGSGTLGTFTFNSLAPPSIGNPTGTGFPAAGCFGNENFVGMGGPAGTEVDVFVCSTAGFFAPFTATSVPSLGPDAVLWACYTLTCYSNFDKPCGTNGAGFGCASGGTPHLPAIAINQVEPLEYSVALLPEPPTFILLASGMLALGLLGATYRKLLT